MLLTLPWKAYDAIQPALSRRWAQRQPSKYRASSCRSLSAEASVVPTNAHQAKPCGSHYDVVVVGLGAFGSAACYHLAKQGLKVLGLERQATLGHAMGSSHGHSRIIRLAYHEGPEYVPLLRRSYKLFLELERASGQQLFVKTGMLDIGPGQVFTGALHAARLHGLPHEVLSGAQVNTRFPGYQLPADWRAVFQPDGGLLIPERIIQAHCELALQHGAELCTGQQVTHWAPQPSPYTAALQPQPLTDARPGAAPAARRSQSHASSADASPASTPTHPQVTPARPGVRLTVKDTSPGMTSRRPVTGGSCSPGPAGAGTAAGEYSVHADWVVLAAGPWMADLVPEVQALLTPMRQVVGWFKVAQGLGAPPTPPAGGSSASSTSSPSSTSSASSNHIHSSSTSTSGSDRADLARGQAVALAWDDQAALTPPPARRSFHPAAFPVFILDDGDGRCWYGFPEHGAQPGFKIGLYNHLQQVVHPDTVSRQLTPADEEALRAAVRRYFPQADGPLLAHSTCMFTNTPDGHFVVDQHPQHPQVVLCSACSGHGFKMSSGIGQLIATLISSPASSDASADSGDDHASDLRELQLHKIDLKRPGHAVFLQAAAAAAAQRWPGADDLAQRTGSRG